jgi:hypothetical protein
MKGKRMRTLITAAIMVALLATPAIALEEGVTAHGDGTCTEADGSKGLTQGDGECITAADYDVMFGIENLSTIPSLIDPSLSVTDVWDLDPTIKPTDRVLGVGLVDVLATYPAILDGAWIPY